MTKYRDILRLASLGISQQNIADSCNVSKKTVNRILKRAKEINLAWPLEESYTEAVIAQKLFPPVAKTISTNKRMPDFEYIHKELQRNGVNKKLLWTEYLEECRLSNKEALMYSQFCHYIQQDEDKRRATMHINRSPAEQIEVDWAGNPAVITDPCTGETTNAWLFVAVMSYSKYPYVEAFPNTKLNAWITAHVHMYNYFGGVSRILVPDNCKTAVVRTNDRYNPQINMVYHEMAEHYNTAIIPARVKHPKDKPNAEGTVGNISTWITAALRNEQFFSLGELNKAIRKRLKEFSNRPFQKKEGSRYEIFCNEELPLLGKLPATPYELAEWKTATVLFNYHISVEGMLYSVPYEYVKRKVDVRITETVIEIFFKASRIASHKRLYGRKGQYSTTPQHMPEDHRQYLEWNGTRFRKWAESIGANTLKVIDAILLSNRVEEQGYRSCMGILKLSDRYSAALLESACTRALLYRQNPSYKSIKNILASGYGINVHEWDSKKEKSSNGDSHAIVRGSDYYRR